MSESQDWRRSTKHKDERFSQDFLLQLQDPFDQSNNKPIIIHQKAVDDITSIGLTIWDGSIALSKYLEGVVLKNPSLFESKRILELGSGTGLLGIACSRLGGQVTFTDYECFDLLNKNIADNQLSRAAVKRLKWGDYYSPSYILSEGNVGDNLIAINQPDAQRQFDYVVAADLVYYPFLIEPLVQTLNVLFYGGSFKVIHKEENEEGEEIVVSETQSDYIPPVVKSTATIFMCAENHNKYSTEKFLTLLKNTFTIEEVPISEHDTIYRHEDIFIWKITTKNQQQ